MSGISSTKRTTAIYAQVLGDEIDLTDGKVVKEEFNPEKIINKYSELAEVEKNPLYTAFTIGIDALQDKKLPD